MGGVFPGAPDIERFWELVRDGRSAAREVPPGRWTLRPDEAYDPNAAPGAPDTVYSKRACFLEDESFQADPEKDKELGLPPELLARLDPLFRIVLRAGHAAWRGAKTEKLNKRRSGLIIGNIALPTEASSALARQWLGRAFEEKALAAAGHARTEEKDSADAFDSLNRYATGLPGGMLAKALGLGGGSVTLDAACASSLYAVKLAADELLAGRADAMLAGGASRPDCLYTQMGFAQLRALSPSGRCAPFDAKADGLVVGEGACFFVLKRLDDALAAGDRILGVIHGAGLSNDLEGSLLAPSSEGQLRAMRAAYAQAGWAPDEVDLIECHATGTPVGDAVEFESLRALWEGRPVPARPCTLGSVKSNVGHLLTGAGAAGLAKTLLALREKTLPPTANFEQPLGKIALEGSAFRVLAKSAPWDARAPGRMRRAAVSAFGFGGINAHLLIEEWDGTARDGGRGTGDAGTAGDGGTGDAERTATAAVKREAPAVPIAVVGMDARFGPWQGLRAFQERVLGGGEFIKPEAPAHWWGIEASRWFEAAGLREIPFAGHYAGDVRAPANQPRRFRIPPKELQEMLPQQALMLLAAAAALEDAGIHENLGTRTGIFIGLGLDLNTTNFQLRWALPELCRTWNERYGLGLGADELREWTRRLREALPPALSANRTMGALGGIAASRIAREFRCGGPSFTLSSEESSGLRALELAARALQRGEIDRALAGAVDLAGDPRAVLGMHARRPFSKMGEARPFDAGADGCIAGEGAAAVVLKRLDDAVRDGDRIYAVIRGLGAATGGRPESPVPDERAYRESLDRALRESGTMLHTLGYLETHGSGIPDEDRMEARALAQSAEIALRKKSCALGSAKADIGHAGAAAGLASFVKASLCLYQEVLPPLRGHRKPHEDWDTEGLFFVPAAPQYWLRDRADGPRRAGVASFSVDGNCAHVILEAHESAPKTQEESAAPLKPPVSHEAERRQPLGSRGEGLFALEAENAEALGAGLRLLRKFAAAHGARPIEALARKWWREHHGDPRKKLGLAIVARHAAELLEQIALAEAALEGRLSTGAGSNGPAGPQRLKGERCFFAPEPLGGKVAFVYPGSGNHFIGMGRGLTAQWPEIPRRQDAENEHLRGQIVPSLFWNGDDEEELLDDARALIFGQVAAGSLFTDLLRSFGVTPQACIGYSLGESAGFFGLRAWKARDEMFRRMRASTLFTMDLAGPCNAARKVWNMTVHGSPDWTVGIVMKPAAFVREALSGRNRVYLLIVNTPQECVIGGQRREVEAAAKALGIPLLEIPGVTIAHCDLVNEVAGEYRELHLFETVPPPNLTFYSGAWAKAFALTRDNAADTILAHAQQGIDFPNVIEAAYRDGARIFIELGPGASCTRMIARILADRPHAARSACIAGLPEESTVLRVLAALVAERAAVDLAALYSIETLCVGHREIPLDDGAGIVVPVGGKAFEPAPPPSAPKPVPPEPLMAPEPEPAAIRVATATVVRREAAPATQLEEPDVAVAVAEAPAQTPSPAVVAMLELAQQITAAEAARIEAHRKYLRFSEDMTRSMTENLALQIAIIERLRGESATATPPYPPLHKGGISQAARMPAVEPRMPAVEPRMAPIKESGAGGDMLSDRGEGASGELLAGGGAHVDVRVRAAGGIPRALDRAQCLAFARGKIGEVLGAAFAAIDAHPTRVRLPDEPLMLVDRILLVEGEPKSMTHGRVVTEHDILPGDWYLDQGRIPTCIAVESGQADLFLSGFLGIDFETKGLACYRLLDAVVTFHRALPGPGETIRYDIRIERFFRQGNIWLFRFSFEATVNGRPLLSMQNGCAGFFTTAELAAGQGIVHTALDKREIPGKRPADWRELTPMAVEAYSEAQLAALRAGDLGACFGAAFAKLGLQDPLRIPGGRMKLVDRVTHLDPKGGRFGLGQIRGEADIHPDDWFLTCHFVDDKVMPGTLMYECCMHTLRIYLLRMGWVCERAGVAIEPVPGVSSGLKCRGQVIETTKKALYEITLKEIGYGPEPYVIADALMYADGKPIVEMTNMSLRMSGVTRAQIEALWKKDASATANAEAVFLRLPPPSAEKKRAVYPYERILAFAVGKPSEAFGEPYKVFDAERVIARLPGPPYQFLDRITAVHAEPWKLIPGGEIEAQYDVPPDAWYFMANRGNGMPFSILLEVALQPCGWFAAYIGSALTSENDLSFRNLGGSATQFLPVRPDSGTLTVRVKVQKIASSSGMIIQTFDYEVHAAAGLVYKGDTYFGFFSKKALSQQVGIRDAKVYAAPEAERARSLPAALFPGESPYPSEQLRMLDRITCFVPDGGPKGLGFIEGTLPVDPSAWFFKAHFYQDPVIPGSLGLESFLQLVKHAAMARWGGRVAKLQMLGSPHRWVYRGQVIPADKRVTVQAVISEIDDKSRTIRADGFLSVDGRVIYQMNDFTLRMP
ncbi:MAG: type I polyketide synthase [Planctomycetes bacterium]|nr:type I polyketide synthase [Planctomycetota bacterium]